MSTESERSRINFGDLASPSAEATEGHSAARLPAEALAKAGESQNWSQNLVGLEASHLIAILLIALTWLIFFWRILFGGQVFFVDDLKILYYPIEHAYAQFQANWQLPTWSPYFGFGQPLLAWGQLGFFTPLHMLLRLFQLHPITLLNISAAAYVALGLLGMYIFLRHRKLSSLPAALGALVFAFCGFTIGHLNHVNFTTATMPLPWMLLAISHFIARPTLTKTALLALITAAIPLSGQPQVSLYTFVIAGIFGIISFIARVAQKNKAAPSMKGWLLKIIAYTLLASALAFSLASFAILPLKEFLPVTDRSGDLSTTELYEFSYPPSHAVTLLFPYYFGDHELYRGAKNFQELAAYVGILPLLLAPLALFVWRRHIAVRVTGLLLIVVALVFTPGIHSPIYRFLVENHILTSLAVPGRFVYFFDVGVAILAALGLETLIRTGQQLAKQGLRRPTPLRSESYGRAQAASEPSHTDSGDVAGGAGILNVKSSQENRSQDLVGLEASIGIAIVVLTAANLLWWGWNYNPLTPRSTALSQSPLANALKQYQETHGVPARLYASETLPLSGIGAVASEPTEPIGPYFTIHQPLRIRENVSCLSLPFITTDEFPEAEITVSLRTSLTDQPFFSTSLSAQAAQERSLQRFCLPELRERNGQDVILTLSSHEQSNLQTFQRLPVADEHAALYVRVENPTPQQLERSKKIAHVVVTQDQPTRTDLEKDLLLRHIQVTAGASAGRWIGALGIGNYRSFVDAFFANDHDPIDGEGVHALTRFRNLVNMSGITHVAQSLPDYEADRDSVLAAGYPLEAEATVGSTRLRLYSNPQAFPKAFLVGTAIWEPGPEQTRYALSHPEYEGQRLIFVNGPTPPETGTLPNAEQLDMRRFSSDVFEKSTATITRYESTRVDIEVMTDQDAWLVLTDSYTPQWHTFIDTMEAPQYVANTVFRAAYVPTGSHTVSFRYHSPAIQISKSLTSIGIIGILACCLPALRRKAKV